MASLQESLLPIFIEETEEGLNLIYQLISAWSKQEITAEILEESRRAAHTIKGTAALVKRMNSSAIAKDMENFLDAINSSGRDLEISDIEQIRCWHGQLADFLKTARSGQPEPLQHDLSQRDAAIKAASLSVQSEDLINDFALPFMMRLHQASEDSTETVRPVCCRFYLGGRQYYLLVEDVVEISEGITITHIPYGPAYIPGLINLRGEVIPVVDLAALEQRSTTFPSVYYLVIARNGLDLMAFLCDLLPSLSLKTAGHKIDVSSFLDQYSIKAS